MDKRDRRTNIIVNKGLEDNPFDPSDTDGDWEDEVITKDSAVAAAVVFTSEQALHAWGQSTLRHIQLISTNKQFRALPKAKWDEILAKHDTMHPYEVDFFDCDSYSAVFVGFTVWNYDINGVARVLDNSAHHSYNAVLCCDDGKTCYWLKVEPQSDTFVNGPPASLAVHAPAGAYVATAGFAITA